MRYPAPITNMEVNPDCENCRYLFGGPQETRKYCVEKTERF